MGIREAFQSIKNLFTADKDILPIVTVGGVWGLFTAWAASMPIEGTFLHSCLLTVLLICSILMVICMLQNWLLKIAFFIFMVGVGIVSSEILPQKCENEYKPIINVSNVVCLPGQDTISVRIENSGGLDFSKYEVYGCIAQLENEIKLKNLKWEEFRTNIRKKGGSEVFTFKLGEEKSLIRDGAHVLFIAVFVSKQIKNGYLYEPYYTYSGGLKGWLRLTDVNLGTLNVLYRDEVKVAISEIHVLIQGRIQRDELNQESFKQILNLCSTPPKKEVKK